MLEFHLNCITPVDNKYNQITKMSKKSKLMHQVHDKTQEAIPFHEKNHTLLACIQHGKSKTGMKSVKKPKFAQTNVMMNQLNTLLLPHSASHSCPFSTQTLYSVITLKATR